MRSYFGYLFPRYCILNFKGPDDVKSCAFSLFCSEVMLPCLIAGPLEQ